MMSHRAWVPKSYSKDETPNIVVLKNIVKSFNKGEENEISVLKNVSVNIKKGEFVGIIGKSGSGKSTLLHLISGLTKANSGEILLFDQKLKDLSDKQLSKIRNAKIGLVFQDFFLLNHLTVKENVELPIMIKTKKHPNFHNKKITNLIEKLGLRERMNHLPSQISGGQKQRTAIARALINEPELLLADEPTGNLDGKTSKEVIDLIYQIHKTKKITTIIVTHDRQIAEKCDRVLEMKNGNVMETNKYNNIIN